MADAESCNEAERLWTTCLNAGIDYRECEKRELIALIHRDPQFGRFEDEIEFARSVFQIGAGRPFDESWLLAVIT